MRLRPLTWTRRTLARLTRPRPTVSIPPDGSEGSAADGRALRVFFVPGLDRCNYRCPYCITGPDHDRRRAWEPGPFHRIIDRLVALPASIEALELGVGGEPLLSSDILDGVRRLALSRNIDAVNLVTNLSPPLAALEDWLGDLPAAKLGFACTYHPSDAGDLGAFVAKVRALGSLGPGVVAGCVAYPPNLPLVGELRAAAEAAGLPLFVNAFVGEYGGRSYPAAYTEAERAFLRPLVYAEHDWEYLFTPRTTRGEPCGAGCSAVMIGPNGDCFRCTYEYNRGLAPLGNLLRDGGLRLFDRYLPCPAEHCFCTAETTSTARFEARYRRAGHFRLYVPRDRAGAVAEAPR